MLQIFGEIPIPDPLAAGYGGYDKPGAGLVLLFNNLFKLVVLAAGLFSIINFIIMGYEIMMSNNEPEKLLKAYSKIWNSIIGLLFIVASFTLAALIGWLLFKDANAILNLKIYGVGIGTPATP